MSNLINRKDNIFGDDIAFVEAIATSLGSNLILLHKFF